MNPHDGDRADGRNARPSGLARDAQLPECLLGSTVHHPAQTLYARHCGRPLRVIAWPSTARPQSIETVEVLHLLEAGRASIDVAAGDSVLCDEADGRILQAIGGLAWPALAEPLAWQFDARLRLMAPCRPEDTLPDAARLRPSSPPPVLQVPGVFPPALSAALIAAHWAGHCDSGVHRRGADGAPALIVDRAAKSRRDHRLDDPTLLAAVASLVAHRLAPAIEAHYRIRVSRHETPKIVAYHAADGGHFAAHRDNVTRDARHRRLALTVNLDAGYCGGGLQFAEYSDEPISPSPGDALLFPCSLLHRVLPVTAGSRHALVSFLW